MRNYVQNRLGPSNDILHRFCLTALTRQDYSPSSVVCVCQLELSGGIYHLYKRNRLLWLRSVKAGRSYSFAPDAWLKAETLRFDYWEKRSGLLQKEKGSLLLVKILRHHLKYLDKKYFPAIDWGEFIWILFNFAPKNWKQMEGSKMLSGSEFDLLLEQLCYFSSLFWLFLFKFCRILEKQVISPCLCKLFSCFFQFFVFFSHCRLVFFRIWNLKAKMGSDLRPKRRSDRIRRAQIKTVIKKTSESNILFR